jgi:sialic acid synthase SpsE
MTAPFIIADVGSNWRRYNDDAKNLECALQHIDEAARAGVSAVKFQLFTHEELYGVPGDDSFALPAEWLPELKAACDRAGVEFMCTAFSAEGVRVVDPHVKRHKIASAEMMHTGILDAVIATGKPFIVSTGGATEADVLAFVEYVDERGGDKDPVGRMSILECVAAYPALPAAYSLREMMHWREAWSDQVGISDHTLSLVVALTAVGCGATVFEKHFLASFFPFDEGGELTATPDEPHSIGPIEMAHYVASIREAFQAMGDGVKKPHESEAKFVAKSRRLPGPDTFRRK